MKISAPEYRGVESLGRNNLGAVGSVASAKQAEGASQSRLANYVGGVAKDFVERKENAEHNNGKTNAMLRFANVEERLGSKTFFTAQEASALPDGTVNLENPDGSPRNDIPAYEVYPYLLDQAQQSIIRQESKGITNPLLRDEFLNLANGIAAKNNLGAALKASKQQVAYYKESDASNANQLAINGNRLTALKVIEENPDYNELERTDLNRSINETWEWTQDDAILNSGDLDTIITRYNELSSEEYGKGKEDFLGPGKASGKYNQEADKKRFKSAIQTLTVKQNNAIVRQTQEYIRAAKEGNVDGESNPLFGIKGDTNAYIDSLPIKEDTKDRLRRDASVATSEGRARNLTLGATFAETNSLLAQARTIARETDAEYFDEASSTSKGIESAAKYQREALLKDASSFLSMHNPAVQGAENKLFNQTNPQLQKAAFENLMQVRRAEQERIGLEPEQINFLSQPEVKAFKEEAAKMGRSPTAASGLIKQINEMEQRYPTEWKQVYTQLIREGALMPEHIVADNIEDPSLQLLYVEALENQEANEKLQVYKDNITDVRRDTENAILALRQTSITPGTFPNNAEGLSVAEQYNALTNGIVQMIMSGVAANGVYDSSDTEKLVEKITQDNWELHENVRIPRKRPMVNGQPVEPYDIDKIKKGLDLSRNKLRISPDLKFLSAPIMGISEADQQAVLREDFLKFSTPQTNENESGITFKWSTGVPVYVMRDGVPQVLRMSFEDLEALGSYDLVTKRERRVYKGWELK